jgi:hypothetical protein
VEVPLRTKGYPYHIITFGSAAVRIVEEILTWASEHKEIRKVKNTEVVIQDFVEGTMTRKLAFRSWILG